jgi:hypothetical protein
MLAAGITEESFLDFRLPLLAFVCRSVAGNDEREMKMT